MRKAAPLLAVALLAAAPAPEVMTLNGLGPLRIGLSEAQLRSRHGAAPEEASPDVVCAYWSSPLHPGVAMMVSGGRLVRIETEDRRYRTPRGARAGMAEAELRARYGRDMSVEPHPYMGPEGKYLIVRARRKPLGMIVETWGGRARSIRVGYWRSVQLIEGCS